MTGTKLTIVMIYDGLSHCWGNVDCLFSTNMDMELDDRSNDLS